MDWLSHYPQQVYWLDCASCGLKRRYAVDAMLARMGDRKLNGLRITMARHHKCLKIDSLGWERCLLRFGFHDPHKRAEVPHNRIKGGLMLRPAGTTTLNGLMDWDMLYAVCVSCRHYYYVDRHKLADHFGKPTRLSDIERHLRCRSCGNRDNNAFAIAMKPR